MNLLERYISRVSNEDAELQPEQQPEQQPELDPVEVEQNDIIAEQELEVPEPVAEVTEVEIDEAEELAEEADAELVDVAGAVEEGADLEAQVQDEITSIEEFTQVLAHGIKTKTFSPQLACVAQAKLSKLSAVFGEESKVSLEDFSGDSLEKYYEVSLETFNGFLKRLSDLLFNASKGLADKLNKKMTVSNYAAKAQALVKRADAVLAGAAKSEEGYTAKGKSVAKDFHIGGKFNGDVVASLTHDLRFLGGPGAALVKSCDSYLSGIMDVVDKAVKDGGVGKTSNIVASALELKRPVDTLPEEAFTGAMAGGLIFVKGNRNAKIDNDTRGQLKDIGRVAIPGVSGVPFKGEADDVVITKDVADKIAKSVKVYVSLAQKIVEKQGIKSLETFYRRIDVQARAIKSANTTSWSENKDLNTLAAKLLDMGWQQFQVYYTLLDTAFDNANEALKLAEKAVTNKAPAAAPAAAE